MLNEKQIENRRKGVGASEAAIVLGLNENISPYMLWLQKTGRQKAEDISNLPPVYWGTIHEETIAQEYAKRFNCNVRRMSSTIYHKKLPFILCHIDRKIEGLPKVLECKFALRAGDAWGESGSDVVPLPYMVQVQHQLACTGYLEADLAVLIAGFDFRVYHFKRDEAVISKIEDALTTFWECVEKDTPPALRDGQDAALAYPLSNESVKASTPEINDVMRLYNLAKAEIAEWEGAKEKLGSKIKLFMEISESIKENGKLLCTWKTNKNGVRQLRVLERGE